jgi:hypothetical protein
MLPEWLKPPFPRPVPPDNLMRFRNSPGLLVWL